MGEVYKARDTRLDRTVAIKVLPSHVADRPELRQRFEREARAVSSLNHPHICALYDIGCQDGIDFLVMEYLEGETMGARLAKGPLPLDQVLRYAIQIADALAQAHRKGVFHRDLKPGNVMLTKSGAKLLDFGLARVGVGGRGSGAGETTLATQLAELTEKGTILGTLQYMAPEQLEGKETDARTDLFAFGAVIHEMATGRKAFGGDSQASVIAAILGHEPPAISSLQPLTPPALDRVVSRCLVKDPDRRWQSAWDLEGELQWIAEGGAAPAPTRPVSRSRPWAWAMAAVFFLATLGFAIAYVRGTPEAAEPTRFSVFPPEKSAFNSIAPYGGPLAVSPDGRRLAFVATGADGKDLIWVRRLEALAAQPLAGTDGATHHFWSADSRSLGFFAGGKLKAIEASGGPVQTLCDAPDGRGGTWSREGVILFALRVGPIYRVSAAGGVAAPATKLDEARRESSHRWPHFLPDGRHFLFLAGSFGPLPVSGANHVSGGSLDSKESKVLLDATSNAAYAPAGKGPSGYVLFVRQAALMAARFDAKRLQITGEAFPVAEQVQQYDHSGNGIFSVSENGVLAYEPGTTSSVSELVWFDRDGKRLGSVGPAGTYGSHQLSPEGRRIALDLVDPLSSTREVWLHDLSRDIRTRFTFDPADDSYPTWSPDGSRVAFVSNRRGGWDLYEKASDGTGREQPMLTSPEAKIPSDWSFDGKFINYTQFDLRSLGDLWILPLTGDRKPFPALQTEFNEWGGQFSPDGRWLAYTSNATGKLEAYVEPFGGRPAPESARTASGPGGKWLVSTNGGSHPRWRRDGKELFYLVPDGKLMAVAVKAGSTFDAGVPRVLFETRVPRAAIALLVSPYAVSADGQRFLIQTTSREATSSSVTVVLNWTAGLKR